MGGRERTLEGREDRSRKAEALCLISGRCSAAGSPQADACASADALADSSHPPTWWLLISSYPTVQSAASTCDSTTTCSPGTSASPYIIFSRIFTGTSASNSSPYSERRYGSHAAVKTRPATMRYGGSRPAKNGGTRTYAFEIERGGCSNRCSSGCECCSIRTGGACARAHRGHAEGHVHHHLLSVAEEADGGGVPDELLRDEVPCSN